MRNNSAFSHVIWRSFNFQNLLPAVLAAFSPLVAIIKKRFDAIPEEMALI